MQPRREVLSLLLLDKANETVNVDLSFSSKTSKAFNRASNDGFLRSALIRTNIKTNAFGMNCKQNLISIVLNIVKLWYHVEPELN